MICRRNALLLGLLLPQFVYAAFPDRPADVVLMAGYLSWVARKSKGKVTIVVETETVLLDKTFIGLASWHDVQKAIPEVARSAATDLFDQSAQRRPINIPPESIDERLRLIQAPRSDIRAVFATDEDLDTQWNKLRQKYEGVSSVVRFSSVGLSSDFEQAVFVAEMSCGPLCGAGTLVFMRRTAEGWKVVKESGLWIS